MTWFYYSKFYFYNGKLNFWFLVCSSNNVAKLWQCWKWHYFSTLLHRYVSVGILISPQHSHNIRATLPQRLWQLWKLRNSELHSLQCCQNLVTTLPGYCSLVGFQHWAPTFTQCSHNITWTLWYNIVFNVVATLWQCHKIM